MVSVESVRIHAFLSLPPTAAVPLLPGHGELSIHLRLGGGKFLRLSGTLGMG